MPALRILVVLVAMLTAAPAVTQEAESKFANANGQLYFVVVYNEKKTKDDKIATTVAKIYHSDGLAWSTNYQLGFSPTEISFKPETGEFTLKGDSQQGVIDKNGKLK